MWRKLERVLTVIFSVSAAGFLLWTFWIGPAWQEEKARHAMQVAIEECENGSRFYSRMRLEEARQEIRQLPRDMQQKLDTELVTKLRDLGCER